jgi:uncharacterized protein YqgV (UPF0045/DUF77 family)
MSSTTDNQAFLLVRLSFGRPQASKQDRQETVTTYGDAKGIEVNKRLWESAHKQAARYVNQCMRIVDTWTMQIGMGGMRCIEASAFDEFLAMLNPAVERARKAFTEIYVDNYERNIEADRERFAKSKRNLFDRADYATKEQVIARTKIRLEQIPMTSDAASNVGGISAKAKQSLEQQHRTRMEAFRTQQSATLIGRLRDQLNEITTIHEENRRNRLAKLEALRDFCNDVLPAFTTYNSNPDLQALVDRINSELLYQMELVKYEPEARSEKAAIATELLISLDNLERSL